MCGIFASLGFAADPARIDVVSHRGPDGRGWKVFDSPIGPVALGHRRLAIIDISEAGLQPMSDESGRYWLVFNGEIYNYIELRKKLESEGHRFVTQTDSEVLLRAYMAWGDRSLDQFSGMFAFAVWDDHRKCLFLARDRFGIKPLYYFIGPQGAAFGSEIKQLRGLPGDTGRMNVRRVYDFLASGMSDHTGETMFQDIRQLRGGECVTLDLSRGQAKTTLPIRVWYRLGDSGTLRIPEAEAGSAFRDLLAQSVTLHLRSDVPVGTCLSGGLDSSSIVSLMAPRLAETGSYVRTISACYSEKEVDERPFMEAVVEHAHAQPIYVYPSADDVFGLAPSITWHQDEPYGGTSIFAQWSVFAAAQKAGLKVMLDGQGADEQLAGYHFAFGVHLASLIRRRRLSMVLRTLMERREFHGTSLFQQIKHSLLPLLPPTLSNILRQKREKHWRHDWLDSEAFGEVDRSRTAFDEGLTTAGLGPVTNIGELCVALTQSSNLGMLLHWEDRNSMAHGIEARVPFLDHRLVEFSIALGDQHKIVGGDTKRVLRRAMQGILPELVRNRRDKLGFSTPEQRWMRGPLRDAMTGAIEDSLARYPALLNVAGVRRLAADIFEGRRGFDFALWRIANIGIWGKTFNVTV